MSPLPASTNQGVPYNVVIFRNRISRVLPMGVQVPVSARVRVAVQVAAPPRAGMRRPREGVPRQPPPQNRPGHASSWPWGAKGRVGTVSLPSPSPGSPA